MNRPQMWWRDGAKRGERTLRRIAGDMLPVAFVFAGVCGFVIVRGRDFNYDQLNSHVPFSFDVFNGGPRRMPVGASGGSLLPALWAVPWWYSATRVPSPLSGLLLATYGVPVLIGARRVGRALWAERTPVTDFVTMVVAASSISFLTEAGTTFGDLASGGFVLLGLSGFLSERSDPMWLARSSAWVGVGVGLKWTNGIFLLSALAVLVVFGPFRVRRVAVAIAVSGATATVVSAPWMWAQWVHYRNPFFPYFNQVFRSRFADRTTPDDPRFGLAPDTLLLFPTRLARGTSSAGEVTARDPRLLFALVVCVVVLGVAVYRRRGGALAKASLFVLTSYIVWGLGFGILRYLVVTEVVANIVLLFVLSGLMNKGLRKARRDIGEIVPRLAAAGMVAGVVLAVGVPNFGHVTWTWSSWYNFRNVVLPVGDVDLLLFDSDRIAFVTFLFPRDAERVGLGVLETPGLHLTERLTETIRSAGPNRYVVFSVRRTNEVSALLAQVDLTLGPTCGDIPSDADLVRWCSVVSK